MADPNEKEMIVIDETGRLIHVPNPAYSPPPLAAFTPLVVELDERSGATVDEPMDVGIEDNDDADDANDTHAPEVFESSLIEPSELSSSDLDEEELIVVVPTYRRTPLNDDDHRPSSVDTEQGKATPPSLIGSDTNNEDRGTSTSISISATPANAQPARGNSTFGAPHHSLSSLGEHELLDSTLDADVPTNTSTHLPDPSTLEVLHHSPCSPSDSDDLNTDDTTILPDMDLPIPISSRIFWERRIRIPNERNLTISAILNRLGLRRMSGERGVVNFEHQHVRQLLDAVTREANAAARGRCGSVGRLSLSAREDERCSCWHVSRIRRGRVGRDDWAGTGVVDG